MSLLRFFDDQDIPTEERTPVKSLPDVLPPELKPREKESKGLVSCRKFPDLSDFNTFSVFDFRSWKRNLVLTLLCRNFSSHWNPDLPTYVIASVDEVARVCVNGEIVRIVIDDISFVVDLDKQRKLSRVKVMRVSDGEIVHTHTIEEKCDSGKKMRV